MYRFIKLPIVNIVLFLILGIIIADKLPLNFSYIYYASIIILLLSFICLVFFDKLMFSILKVSIFINVLFILVGISLHTFNNYKNYEENHYLNHIKDKNNLGLKIYDIKNDNSNLFKCLAKVFFINGIKSTGNIILYINKINSDNFNINDSILITNSKISKISLSKNIYHFDYEKYMGRKKVYRSIYTEYANIKKIEGEYSYSREVYKYKSLIFEGLNKYFSSQEAAILQSLILGDRRGLSEDNISNYTNAGIIHILAISGLHVGIIFIILSKIFGFLNNIKRGKILFTAVILFLLWFYAFIIGFSSSVVRATLMFSLYLISINLLNYKSNNYNLIFISAFILLLLDTNNLFDIGFQFSYLAVLGIAIFYPLIFSSLKFRFSLVRFFWSIISVTLACQILISPLMIFYFYKFSALFLFSTILIIPITPIIISLGFIVVFLIYFQFHIHWLFYLYNQILYYTNYIIKFIASFDKLIIKEISWSISTVILIYILILFLSIYIDRKKLINLYMALVILIGMSLNYLISDIILYNLKELVIYDTKGYSMLSIKERRTLYIFIDGKRKYDKIIKTIKPYILKNNIKDYKIYNMSDTLHSNFFVKSKNFIGLKNNIFYIYRNKPFNKNKNITLIILKRYKNIKDILESNKYSNIIMKDNYINRSIKKYIKDSKIKLHNINDEGYFSIKY